LFSLLHHEFVRIMFCFVSNLYLVEENIRKHQVSALKRN
jgi:hypothetical protein